MNATPCRRCLSWVLMVSLLALAVGCQRTADGRGPASKGGTTVTTESPVAAKAEPFDGSKGYLHKESGIGFIYPEGWDKLPVKTEGAITRLGVRKEESAIVVTLYWTEMGRIAEAINIGEQEFAALRPLYQDRLGKPEAITSGKQSGYKIAIAGGPVGIDNPNLAGVVYVFLVQRGRTAWKIKLRATVHGRDKLDLVEKLLDNYRWE